MKDMLDQYASLYGDRVPFYTSSAQSITGAVTAVNTSADLQQFINQNKTGVRYARFCFLLHLLSFQFHSFRFISFRLISFG